MMMPSQKLWMLSPRMHAPAAPARLLLVEAVVVMVRVALVVVAVPVELGLLEQEEEQQAAEQGREQRLRAGLALERLGQDVEQRGAEQHAGRQAHQVLDQPRQHRQRQPGGDDDRQHAAGEGGEDDPGEGHAAPLARAARPTAALPAVARASLRVARAGSRR